ncbi:MAG: hypothetical protein LBV69_06230, partial [Bacteroidales bacterium]|nr:hypothetical protein [Bacteroidales bacterium]
MKKKIFILFFFVNFCISVINAAYVKDMPYQITQPNGQIINCFITGDEYHRRVFDENGFTIIQHPETGYYVYAVLQNDDLVATNYIVGQTNPVTVGLIANQDISATKKTQKRQFRQSLIPHDEVITPKAATLRTGTLNNITIYIKFSDGNFTHTKTAIEDYYMNPTRGASLFAYYRDISDGNFNMVSTFYPSTTGTTVLAYTDTHPRSYFQPYNASTNTNGYTTEYGTTATAGMYRLHTLFKAAIIDLKTTIESEFTAAQLDYDADNYVDNISFIIQGSSDGWSDILWPHRFNITYGTPTGNIFLNGKRCSDYFLVLENHLFSVTNGHQSVLCHEMYHVLGAPDLYRYDDETIDPIAQWDIMCQNAVPPQHSTAYIADKYGKFIYDVPEITQCGTYAVYPLWDRTPGHNIAFKIRSSLSTTQWYYIEYRKKTGEVYESSNWITGQGLIIYRVNTTVSDGNADGPPDEVYVFRPGGTNNTTDGNINNAFFSSQSGRTTFNSTSNPKCFTSTNAVDNIDISMIS